MTDRKLIELAVEAMEKSYSPYSRVRVGAAIECSDGTAFIGCNIENIAIGATICAEKAAIASAVSAGHRSFRRIAIVAESGSYRFPCGACRQLLIEFSTDLEVLSARGDGRYVSYPLSTLLPMPFGGD